MKVILYNNTAGLKSISPKTEMPFKPAVLVSLYHISLITHDSSFSYISGKAFFTLMGLRFWSTNA